MKILKQIEDIAFLTLQNIYWRWREWRRYRALNKGMVLTPDYLLENLKVDQE